MSCTAASMCPLRSHCGSNMGDLLGMRTYATSRSRMELSQVLPIEPLSPFRSMSDLIRLNNNDLREDLHVDSQATAPQGSGSPNRARAAELLERASVSSD